MASPAQELGGGGGFPNWQEMVRPSDSRYDLMTRKYLAGDKIVLNLTQAVLDLICHDHDHFNLLLIANIGILL